MRTATALLLVSLLPAAAQTPAPGTLTPYRNNDLRLTYSVPANMTDASAIIGPALEASMSGDSTVAAQVKCVSMPFARSAPDPAGGGPNIILLVRADAACLHKKFNAHSVTEMTQGESQGLSAFGAKANLGRPFNYQVSNRPASVLTGSFVLPTGQAVQSMVVCVLDEPDIACWQFLAGSPERLRTFSSYPVTFDGAPATPLTPPGQ